MNFITVLKKKSTEFKFLTESVGELYVQFCIELSNPDLLNQFKDCFFALCTQAIQSLFINISKGEPETISKEFRMKICSYFITIFTALTPLDTQQMKTLGLYFKSPPMFDGEIHEDIYHFNDKTTLKLPTENLHTLVNGLDKRTRPKPRKFRLSGLSPEYTAGSKLTKIPAEKEALCIFNIHKVEKVNGLQNCLLCIPLSPI